VRIRGTAYLIATGTLAVLLLVVVPFVRAMLLVGAAQMEREQVVQDLQRVQDAVLAEVGHLESTVADWATWDDTYAFAGGENPAYVQDNLDSKALQNLRVDLFLLLDPAGGRFFVADRTGAAAPAVRDSPPIPLAGGEDRAGLILWGDIPLLMAARKVLRSDGSGPPRGMLLFGRIVGPALEEEIAKRTHLEATLRRIDPGHDLPLPGAGHGGTLAPNRVVVEPISSQKVEGRTVLAGLDGRPVLRLGVSGPRRFLILAERGARYFLLFFLAFSLAIGGVGILLLERRVISRVAVLSSQVMAIQGAEDAAVRVQTSGEDEITDVGREVNAMLERMEGVQRELRKARDGLEERVRLRTAELEAANQKLRSLDKMKDALIGDITHELRTPVAKQAMQLEILRQKLDRGELSGEFTAILEILERTQRRQQSVISNILQMSRLEAGGRETVWAPLKVDEFLAELVSDFQGLLTAHGVTVRVSAPPLTLVTDREFLWHVFSNLLSNAVKYRGQENPRVEIEVRKEGESILVALTDNGVGIAPEARGRIFDRFFQASTAVEGVGLGLYLVRVILGRLGGSIDIESPGVGQGTTALVRLPLLHPESGRREDVSAGPPPEGAAPAAGG
jgi:signal transduction histidine kinase